MGTHLWFVPTDPDPVTTRVVIVALVTQRGHTERTVTLDVGDHPFIGVRQYFRESGRVKRWVSDDRNYHPYLAEL